MTRSCVPAPHTVQTCRQPRPNVQSATNRRVLCHSCPMESAIAIPSGAAHNGRQAATSMLAPHLGVQLARAGYSKYGAELKALHRTMNAYCVKPVKCFSCTLEMELSYMRLRELKPRVVWEISPADGFSTVVILHALAANSNNATLHSFDLLSASYKFLVGRDRFPLLMPMWNFHKRNAQTLVSPDGILSSKWEGKSRPLPPPDYLYLDSKHNVEMATLYTSRLLPAVMRLGHIPVSLHDVYNPLFWTDGSFNGKRDLRVLPEWLPNLEGAMVLDWLSYGFQSDSCNLFTIAPSKVGNAPHHAAVLEIREARGGLKPTNLFDPHHGKCPEPTIYFELNCSASSSREHRRQHHRGNRAKLLE